MPALPVYRLQTLLELRARKKEEAERELSRTMAELTDAEKDAISHRGHAARALVKWIRR